MLDPRRPYRRSKPYTPGRGTGRKGSREAKGTKTAEVSKLVKAPKVTGTCADCGVELVRHPTDRGRNRVRCYACSALSPLTRRQLRAASAPR